MPRNPVQFQNSLSEPQFYENYGSEKKCLEVLESLRRPNGFVCPECFNAAVSAGCSHSTALAEVAVRQ